MDIRICRKYIILRKLVKMYCLMEENHGDYDYNSDLVTLDLNFIFFRELSLFVMRVSHTYQRTRLKTVLSTTYKYAEIVFK